MNKRKIIMNVFLILTIIMMLSTVIIPNYCYAKDKTTKNKIVENSITENETIEDTLGLGDLDKYQGTNPGSTKLVDKANIILGSIRNIGIVLSVVILIVIGIKYMLGSAEEKANYKETLLPYIIGAFLLFTGSLIPQLIYDFMQNF